MTQTCKVDIHQETWDLTGELTAEWYNKSNPTEPCSVIHADQTLVVKVRLTLGGRILNYLCDTQIGCNLAFETCGPGSEFETCLWRTIEPCKDGGNVIDFEFEVPGGTLESGECGRQYTLCITLGSKDCCGKSGFVYGACHDFHIAVLPPDVD
jgi:hypothetical protein